MNTKLKTAPSKMPITLEEAKNHLRLELDFTVDDEYIKTLISTATQTAEQFLHRRLITQTWYYYLNCWPGLTAIDIIFGRLQSVTSIKYKDTAGDETTWDSGNYIVNIDSDPGQIVLDYNKSWPTAALYPSNPITVEYVCGYGLAGSNVEANIIHAIKIIISNLYENRESEVISAGTLFELPTVLNLLTPFKIDWF